MRPATIPTRSDTVLVTLTTYNTAGETCQVIDPAGNWRGASTGYLTKVSGTTTLNQNRTHNKANEATGISTTTGTAWPTPTQNAVGNMTQMPQPLSLGSGYDCKYDAWNRLVEVKVTGGVTRHFYYSLAWQILEKRTGTSANYTLDRQFV